MQPEQRRVARQAGRLRRAPRRYLRQATTGRTTPAQAALTMVDARLCRAVHRLGGLAVDHAWQAVGDDALHGPGAASAGWPRRAAGVGTVQAPLSEGPTTLCWLAAGQ